MAKIDFGCALLLGVTCCLGSLCDARGASVLLDDFTGAGIREVRPEESEPSRRYLWSQYENDPTEGPDPGSEHLTTTTAYRGTQSLEITVDAGNLYLQFYPYPSPGYAWHYMRTFTQPATEWQFDTYNRMRFWVKVPPGVTKTGGGNNNMHVGTYVRCSTCDTTKAESDNGHFYHHFDLSYTGEWHQIIVDTHPDHQRGASGGTELGDRPYPSGESGFNYFDALTRFYVELKGALPTYPAVFQFDAFELYRETRPENIEQVYSLNGVYVPATNEIMVGWQRHKDENAVRHEVRYAFADIHQIGWQAATPAPDGVVAPLGWQGYNGMEWHTQAIDVSGVSQIYIAIKPQNATTFRQLTIPIAGALPPTSPENVGLIPQAQLAVVSVDSAELVGEDGAADNAIDDQPQTQWVTQWLPSSPAHPHEIIIDLNGYYWVDGFRYLPRQDGNINGTVADYRFYVSIDGVNWGEAVASGTFAADLNAKEVIFPSTAGRFVRFVSLREANGMPWTAVAELNIMGTPSPPLAVEGVTPNAITAGSSVDITINGTGFIPDAVITFENGKGASPKVSNIAVTASTITAILTAETNGPPRDRIWDVRVTNPDGVSEVLIGGLTIGACCKKR